MSRVNEGEKFIALDECHRQMLLHLEQLRHLMLGMQSAGLDDVGRAEAAEIEAFFSGASRQHHAEEERSVFPELLNSDQPELVSAVRSLQQDHGWIEENWVELGPRLRALASGSAWVDETEFLSYAQVFMDLVSEHLALEESLIYPESKARWAQALQAREHRRAQAGLAGLVRP